MAQDLDDGELWLPSEFLTDDHLLTDFKKNGGDYLSCGFGSLFGFHSDLSSPVESVTGSTETESDEDDFISFLTQKMNYSTLNDSTKGWIFSGSPQSTLCGCKPVLSPVSPKSVSQVSSPPRYEGAVSWDMLFYETAEKVARLRMNEAAASCHQPKITYPPLKPSPVTVPRLNRCQASGLYPNPKTQAQLSCQKMLAIQQLKNEVWEHGQRENQFQNAIRIGVDKTQELSAAAWPTLLQSQRQPQQMPSSGRRAVFLAENGAKKKRTGTGVFLPRGYGINSTETNRKPGSTVLLPDKVVHTLNLNLGSINTAAQAKSRGVQFNADAGFKRKNSTIMAQQGRNLTPQPVVNQEFCLPQEWTY